MLNIPGPASRYCDGISRRSFLKAGTFAFGAASFNMVDILRAEERAGKSSSNKSVINIYLGGGPSHMDMWDIKTEAPVEFRGEFRPISTSVPGIQISEIFPKVAELMHKCVVIRSLVGCREDHSPIQCYNGYTIGAPQPIGGRPSMGAIISRLHNGDASVPPFIGLAPNNIQHVPYRDPGQPGFLGPSHAAFRPDGPGPGLENMTLRDMSVGRLNDRRRILDSIDDMQREVDFNSTLLGLDSARARALDVLTSNKLVQALDISREPAAVRARYGDGRPHLRPNIGIPPMNEQLLIARRLVQAGVRCITLTYADWDTHGQNFYWMRYNCTRLDQCLSALIEDLDIRGMLDDVTILVWGEFGRTPRVNGGAGRDHWAPVSCCFMAGGGMRTGQAIGSTTRLGERAESRPVTHAEIFATVYHNMGIAPNSTIIDSTGRPFFLTDRAPLPELV